MYLDQILSSYNITIPKEKIKLIRHVPRHEIDWTLIKKGYFDQYQSIQRRSDVMNRDYFLSFLVDDRNRTIFKGVYHVLECKPYQTGDLPLECETHWYKDREAKLYCFHNEKLDLLDDLIDRLVIDWGEGKRKWDQNYHNKRIQEILPIGFLDAFTGYLDVSLKWNQLERILSKAGESSDWKTALSKVFAVYLILDEDSGKQYIGSACGKEGLWGRWKEYSQTKHGNNKELKALLKQQPYQNDNFRFSILEVLPNTLTKEEVIARESRVKEKLGTRAFGLNLN